MNTYEDEAKHIAKVIKEYYLKGKYDYKDFAIFYRVNLQSRAIEDALRSEGLPYRIVGGIGFYQRKEVKDLVAYMRLALNRGDNVSFRRIINTPHRGIGVAALSKIEHEAKKKSLSLFNALKSILRGDSFSNTLREKLQQFVKLIEGFSNTKYKFASDMLKNIFEKTGYIDTLDEEKLKNVIELISSAESQSVKEFIDKISLFTNMDEACFDDCISLMTLHNAKGLEFPFVFIAGLEEGLLPYFKALKHEEEIAEERRLFYVGMTRAKEILWLTGASKRKLYSKTQEQEPSRFLKDIPKECCHWVEKISVPQEIKAKTIKTKIQPKNKFALYSIGCRVRHPAWGIGVVRDCYGDGDDLKITVNFPNIGLKRLAVRYANLEKV